MYKMIIILNINSSYLLQLVYALDTYISRGFVTKVLVLVAEILTQLV